MREMRRNLSSKSSRGQNPLGSRASLWIRSRSPSILFLPGAQLGRSQSTKNNEPRSI